VSLVEDATMPTLRTPPPFPLAPLVLAALALAAPAARADEPWKFDVVRLKNGHTFQGLLVKETPDEIQFRCVSRNPTHTVVIPTTFDRAEVDGLDRLDAEDRKVLADRLDALDPTGKGEAQRMASLELKPVTWGKDRKKAWRYESAHFVLESNAPEDVVRRAAVRLEQVFAAYDRYLPPRQQSGQPTTILLARSLADYQALLKEQGRVLLNPAFYDTERNQIVCGSDLQRLGDQLEQARQENQQLLKRAKDSEADLVRLFKGRDQIPANLLRPIRELRARVDAVNKKNDEQFEAATRQLFRALYHEAFHAYLANFVYPPAEADVPRWLNEGLAQIFETAVIEAGELRVGHADPDRLAHAQKALRRRELVPLPDLLRSKSSNFVVQHASDQQTSDRYYLTSWAVAFDLTFDRRLLGTRAMDDYVHGLRGGADPVAAFERLVGQAPARFEAEFQQYLSDLRPDGTVARKAPR
jgi:hypothetical protein